MRLDNLTLPTPELNLALDEALLLDSGGAESLRLWESPTPLVVLGRSSRLAEEVDVDACRERRTPILRRVSGGASIVAGPGCLMYAVVLDLTKRPELVDLTKAHRYVLGRLVAMLRTLEPTATDAGTSDLAVRRGDALHKFSGNSVRRVRNRLLYHGTLLYGFDLSLIGHLLRTAPRQPDYRGRRDHDAFVTNLVATRSDLVRCLTEGWSASAVPLSDGLLSAAQSLVDEKYTLPEWNEMR